MSTKIQSSFRSNRSNRAVFSVGTLLIVLMALAISACFSPAAEANTAPAACLDDQGDPVEPLPYVGAWAIILNFNHSPSTTHTEVCWAIRGNDVNMTVSYTDGINCQIRNNLNSVAVGNGSADFDGTFHITCPRRSNVTNPNALYETFYVHAEAEFEEKAAIYPLVTHSDAAVKVRFTGPDNNGDWNAQMASRYGEKDYKDFKKVTMAPGVRHRLNSTVYGGMGTHIVNAEVFNSPNAIDPFEFDYTELIFIGGGDIPWTLHEMVIDPPGICQSNC